MIKYLFLFIILSLSACASSNTLVKFNFDPEYCGCMKHEDEHDKKSPCVLVGCMEGRAACAFALEGFEK